MRKLLATAACLLLLAGCGGSQASTEPTATRAEIPRGGDNIQP